MSRPVVFAGPSIAGTTFSGAPPGDDADQAAELDPGPAPIDLRRPAAAGDILDAAEADAPVIALIDGYFDRVPAPWHKEILIALDAGIPVVGGASLGALRAAELDVYGMVGVGWVYEQFASGVLLDDDEVAVAHGVEGGELRPFSDAMVDIRWSLARALEESRLDRGEHDRLIELAKGRFYIERSFLQLRADARSAELGCAGDVELWQWLGDPERSIKRMDACAVIAEAIAAVGTTPPGLPAEVPETGLVRRLRNDIGHRQGGSDATAIVQELRLDPVAYQFVWEHALRTELAVREAERLRYEPPTPAVDSLLHSMMPRSPLGHAQRARIARREASAHHVSRLIAAQIDHRLVDTLHALGLHTDVAERASRKAGRVGVVGQRPRLPGPRPTDRELIEWYFTAVLGQPLPEEVERWAVTMGYRSTADFADALLREWAFHEGARTARGS